MFEQPSGLLKTSPSEDQLDETRSWSFEDTEAYRTFRSQVALRRVIVDEDDTKMWSYYETGPKEVLYPVIFLPPVSGSADVFFHQMMYLSSRGHRVISLEYPAYYTLQEFLVGFKRFLKRFSIRGVHLFGASLGGFLAQKFAERYSIGLVHSLILCNTFGDTSRFKFWFAPAPILRSLFIKNKVAEEADEAIQAASRFMAKRLANLSQSELISRLTLNLTDNFVQPECMQSLLVTIIDVFDRCANSEATQQELYKLYPHARLAHLESGGNYPYLSRADDVNMHILVHLRKFDDTLYSSNVHHLAAGPKQDHNQQTDQDSKESNQENSENDPKLDVIDEESLETDQQSETEIGSDAILDKTELVRE